MTVLAVLQPGYLPWLGFFDQVRRADIFVYYDDVQFDKQGWRNRNRIKTAQGIQWLSVPIRHSGRMGQRIDEVEIVSSLPWAHKHLASIRQAYARAPFLETYLPELQAVLSSDWQRLVELDIAISELMCRWFGLTTQRLRASTLAIEGDRNERLLWLCRHVGADRYLSGNAAQSYLDVTAFAAAGITVEWQDYAHPSYPQLHGPFEPYLSALDLLLNMGPQAADILAAKRPE